jgi:hypothetical protein
VTDNGAGDIPKRCIVESHVWRRRERANEGGEGLQQTEPIRRLSYEDPSRARDEASPSHSAPWRSERAGCDGAIITEGPFKSAGDANLGARRATTLARSSGHDTRVSILRSEWYLLTARASQRKGRRCGQVPLYGLQRRQTGEAVSQRNILCQKLQMINDEMWFVHADHRRLLRPRGAHSRPHQPRACPLTFVSSRLIHLVLHQKR